MTSLIYNLAKRRKTVRKFSKTSVDWKDLIQALISACQAPSGANSQPWRFVIVIDSQIKKRIREACECVEKDFYSKVKGELREWLLDRGFNWKKPYLEEAPLLILVFSEKKAPYSTQSVWLAIGYFLLAIEELGLGTVTYTPSTIKGVHEELGVPEEFRLEAILPIGISVDEKVKEQRLSLDEVTYLHSWGNKLIIPKYLEVE